MRPCFSLLVATINILLSFLLTHAFLVHFLDKNVYVVTHSFQIVSEKLVFSPQEFLLFVILNAKIRHFLTYIGKRLQDLWSSFHLFNFALCFLQGQLDEPEWIWAIFVTRLLAFHVSKHAGAT